MNKTLVILNPVLGGKIRGVLNTVFAVFVLVLQFWPELSDEGWTGTVVKVCAFPIALIQVLTHATTVGNDES